MKISQTHFAFGVLILICFDNLVQSQRPEGRNLRPTSPEKCDRFGRCLSKEGYIEVHEDDYKSDTERPPSLTRDDWPVRPQDDPKSLNPPLDKDLKDEDRLTDRDIGYGRGTGSKPVVSTSDDLKSIGGGRTSTGGGYSGGYKPPPLDKDLKDEDRLIDRDMGYGRGTGSKPVVGASDDLKPIGGGRISSGGGYGGGYKPPPLDKDLKDEDRLADRDIGYGRGTSGKPAVDASDDLKPIGGGRISTGGGGGGGYKPKLVDTSDPKPFVGGRPTDDVYNLKPAVDRGDDYDIGRPVRGGGGGGGGGYGGSGYQPKPVVDRGDISPARPSRGGYNRRPGGHGGVRPKPVSYDDKYIEDRDTNIGRPSGYGGRGEKKDKDDYDIKPARGGYPDDDGRSTKEDLGGYNKPKDDDYNDEYDGKYDGSDDDDYDGGSKPIPVKDEENCICVPYYQCKDGHIVVDGAGIIDARKRPDPDEELPLDGKFKPPSCGPFHVCCNTPETSTVRPYEHRCGVRNPSGINSRILSPSNKGEADFGEWPWQAAVLKEEGKVNIFQCGGVLIDKLHVLTVAHCVFHLYQLNDYPLKVRLGEWDTQTTTEFLAHEDYKVSKIIIHPEFKNSSLWNDLAILKLQEPVLFAPHIDTVCLPQHDEVFAGQNCVVTGWGKDAYKGGTFSNVMKEVVIQAIDNYKCEEMLRKTRLGRFFQLHEGFMCAGGEFGLDSCKGDGGGPLVCYRKNKSYALAGIVSWGIDCGQPGVPGVYVKIQKYLDWISKCTGESLQEYWPKK